MGSTMARMLLMVMLAASSLAACAEKTMELTVVVFNYWPRPIADVSVNGQYAGGSFGAFGPGGTGGKSVCCVEVQPGEVEVNWTLDGPRDAPRLGEEIHAKARLGEIPHNAQYLSVYIYPDSTVSMAAGRYPIDKRPAEENE